MGFESFRVELRGGSTTYSEIDETIQKSLGAKIDRQSLPTEGSTYYTLGDGQHVIEIELRDAPLRLSCRFTLCHPPSVDVFFLDLLRELMLRLGMETRICDDVRPEHERFFSFSQFAEFSSVISHYIAARRAEWIAAFGTEQIAASTNEVHERIILPWCRAVVE